MKKLAIYILLAFMIWTLPALATIMGEQTEPGSAESGKAIAAQNQTAETNSPTGPTTALLLGAGLIGLVAFSRNRVRE
jgi:hypothetical protein